MLLYERKFDLLYYLIYSLLTFLTFSQLLITRLCIRVHGSNKQVNTRQAI